MIVRTVTIQTNLSRRNDPNADHIIKSDTCKCYKFHTGHHSRLASNVADKLSCVVQWLKKYAAASVKFRFLKMFVQFLYVFEKL